MFERAQVLFAAVRRSEWWKEWGVLALVCLVALPLFTPRVYGADEIKYFSTLRSLYMDRDLHYENEYGHFVSRDPVAHVGLVPYRDEATPTGYRLNDAPIGTAILWAPFYAMADGVVVVARGLGHDVARDGYSPPYVWAVCLASLCWGLAGLALVYRLCRRSVGRRSARCGVLAMWLASPVVFYLYVTPAMAHANSLFAVALFLTLWQRARSTSAVSSWFALGASAGLMVLVRELNWLGLTVVAVDELMMVGARIRSIRPEFRPGTGGRIGAVLSDILRARTLAYAGFLMALAATVAPQFYVYQTLNGTYGPTPFVVEKFSALPVYSVDVLFSGFHGLFSWHPITAVGAAGLIAMLFRSTSEKTYDVRLVVAFVTFFVVQVLVVGSYATWWGGASFGARRFINCTPLLAVGVAAVHARLHHRLGRGAAVVLVLFVVWNAGLAIQYSTGMISRSDPVRMSRIVYNQFVEVPPRVVDIAWRFFFDRQSFYRTRS